ncbi:MAG: hypothetical protein A2142_04460 [candidate division Zixibacteria bacterium RBG_16_48_11]|nr:MAG: hypothetical protein A2142_04460 [candidate division Zixibacteria bacterium RBG_16_48_11]
MTPPAFSIFAAIAELAVTAIVYSSILSHIRGKPFRLKLLGFAILFEAIVNVTYMVTRFIGADSPVHLSAQMKLLATIHGTFSMPVFIWLIILFFLASSSAKLEQNFFRDHKLMTYVFLILWRVSVASGEVMFLQIYL